jgi:uncharacterized protein (TIGR02444 family)
MRGSFIAVMGMGDGHADAFWRFSLMTYARPGIAEALIRLQDEHGHNVNLILFGLWLGLCEGVRLDAVALTRARAATAALDDGVIAPLRRLRQALKDDPDPDMRGLRRRVLALELAAERRVQARLVAFAVPLRASPGDRRGLAEANLRRVLGPDFSRAETEPLRRLTTRG